VQRAARDTRDSPEFKNDSKLANFKFSNPWVKGFLSRAQLRRRRVTTKETPSVVPAAIQARNLEIQAVLDAGPPGGQPSEPQGYALCDIVNSDETAARPGECPLNQYVPASARRGSTHEFVSPRFTSLLAGTPCGMLPSFNITKCTVKQPDLRSTTVISTLFKHPGFKAADGWDFKVWSKTLNIKNNKTKAFVDVTFHRPYIIHRDRGDVITTQHKAWMDTAGAAMWIELVLGPWAARSGRKKVLIWDNVSCHRSPCLAQIFAHWNIHVEQSLANATSETQVMDLVVNGPIRSRARAFRASDLYAQFQTYLMAQETERSKPAAERKALPPFNPTSPKLTDGITMLLNFLSVDLATAEFAASLRRCFIHVGLIKQDSGSYRVFTGADRGTLGKAFASAPDVRQVILGDLLGGHEITTTDTADEDEDEDDDSSESNSESSSSGD